MCRRRCEIAIASLLCSLLVCSGCCPSRPYRANRVEREMRAHQWKVGLERKAYWWRLRRHQWEDASVRRIFPCYTYEQPPCPYRGGWMAPGLYAGPIYSGHLEGETMPPGAEVTTPAEPGEFAAPEGAAQDSSTSPLAPPRSAPRGPAPPGGYGIPL